MPHSVNSIRDTANTLINALGDQAADAYIVGGAVRDFLLESESVTDLDLVIAHTQDAVRTKIIHDLAWAIDGRAGLLHEDPLTYRISSSELHLDISFCAGPIEDDLDRRDFTLNAIAVPLVGWEDAIRSLTLIAPHGGWRDLHNRKLSALNPSVFQDDPVRMLRAVRIAARLGLHIDAETAQQITRDAHLLAEAAPERITEELLRILEAPESHTAIEEAHQLGLLEAILPGVAANAADWQRTLATLAAMNEVTTPPDVITADSLWTLFPADHFEQKTQGEHSRRTVLKLAVLLLRTLKRPQTLRLSNHAASLVTRIITHRGDDQSISAGRDRANLKRVYRFYRDAGDAAVDILFLTIAKPAAGQTPDIAAPERDERFSKVRHILDLGLHQGVAPQFQDRLVNGRDLTAHLDRPSGDWIRPILEKIDEARATGEITTRRQALQMATALHRNETNCTTPTIPTKTGARETT